MKQAKGRQVGRGVENRDQKLMQAHMQTNVDKDREIPNTELLYIETKLLRIKTEPSQIETKLLQIENFCMTFDFFQFQHTNGTKNP